MAKLKSLTIKDSVRDVFSKALINGGLKICKIELTKKIRGHDKLWDKDLRHVNRALVSTVYELTEEWLKANPQILIFPYPKFSRQYEGWQIITKESEISNLMRTIAEENFSKDVRRLYRLYQKIQKEALAGKKMGLIPNKKAKEIIENESQKYKESKPIILLSDSRK